MNFSNQQFLEAVGCLRGASDVYDARDGVSREAGNCAHRSRPVLARVHPVCRQWGADDSLPDVSEVALVYYTLGVRSVRQSMDPGEGLPEDPL